MDHLNLLSWGWIGDEQHSVNGNHMNVDRNDDVIN
jgi:hypothetical protein